jgi:hypothetical protein
MMLRHVELFDMKIRIEDAAKKNGGRTQFKLGKYYIGDDGLWKAVATMEAGAHQLAAKVQLDVPQSQVFLDHFVAIDGPPFQRYFDPEMDIAAAVAPCTEWMQPTDDGKGCTFFSTTDTDMEAVERLLNIPSAMIRFASSFMRRPVASASWVRPRMKKYRWPVWRNRMVRIEQAALMHPTDRGTVLFIADSYMRKAPTGIPHITWAVVNRDGVGAGAGGRKTPIRLVILDGEIKVYNHPAAPAVELVLTQPGQWIELTNGAEHGLVIVSKTALWYYQGSGPITPIFESSINPKIGAITSVRAKLPDKEWEERLFQSSAGPPDTLPAVLDGMFGAPPTLAPHASQIKLTQKKGEKKKKKKKKKKTTRKEQRKTEL